MSSYDKRIFNTSVHKIVDLLLRTGDIDTRFFNINTLKKGREIHKVFQDSLHKTNSASLSEVKLQHIFEFDLFNISVIGFADDISIDQISGNATIIEYKSTLEDLNDYHNKNESWHLMQAMFYAYMFNKNQKKDKIQIQLIYIDQKKLENYLTFDYFFTIDTITKKISEIMYKYYEFIKKIFSLKIERQNTCKDVSIPFKTTRSTQKEMIDFILSKTNSQNYKIKEDINKIFIQAPTGTGKTAAVLLTAIQCFGKDKYANYIYTTNNNNVKKIAMQTFEKFYTNGYRTKSIEISGKENICPHLNKKCNPEDCPLAAKFYDNLFNILNQAIDNYDIYSSDYLKSFCIKHSICPYHFQLVLSEFCDMIVCDYNNVFDMDISKVLNETNDNDMLANTLLMIDEAHTLHDRVREMYSIDLNRKDLDKVLSKCSSKQHTKISVNITTILNLLDKIYNSTILEKGQEIIKVDKFSIDIIEELTDLQNNLIRLFEKSIHNDDCFENLFFSVRRFLDLNTLPSQENLNDSFLRFYKVNDGKIISLSIENIYSAELIRKICNNFKLNIFFSGTLSPIDYQVRILGGDPDLKANILVLNSLFPIDNQRIMIDTSIKLNYKNRYIVAPEIAKYIKLAISYKKGNYMVACPSISYAELIYNQYKQLTPLEKLNPILQKEKMNDIEKKEFLNNFINSNNTIGFIVIGGSFSQAIDLPGNQLIGMIILSTAMENTKIENKVKMEYLEQTLSKDDSFAMTYLIPPAVKIIQTAGRVIRSETDKGFVLFIDSRYSNKITNKTILEAYPNAIHVSGKTEACQIINEFWNKNNE